MVPIPCNWSTSGNSDNSEEIGSNSDASECEVDMSQPVTQENHERDESKQWAPNIDLSHLIKDQQEAGFHKTWPTPFGLPLLAYPVGLPSIQRII